MPLLSFQDTKGREPIQPKPTPQAVLTGGSWTTLCKQHCLPRVEPKRCCLRLVQRSIPTSEGRYPPPRKLRKHTTHVLYRNQGSSHAVGFLVEKPIFFQGTKPCPSSSRRARDSSSSGGGTTKTPSYRRGYHATTTTATEGTKTTSRTKQEGVDDRSPRARTSYRRRIGAVFTWTVDYFGNTLGSMRVLLLVITCGVWRN